MTYESERPDGPEMGVRITCTEHGESREFQPAERRVALHCPGRAMAVEVTRHDTREWRDLGEGCRQSAGAGKLHLRTRDVTTRVAGQPAAPSWRPMSECCRLRLGPVHPTGPASYRYDRKKVRRSSTNSSGTSIAGKCPPSAFSVQWTML